jgi:hypothetical protein
MPTDGSEWTDEQFQKIVAWLDEKWGHARPCPQCGASQWGILQYPAHLLMGRSDGSTELSGNYPCIGVMCNNCGNTILVNALKSGVQLPKPKEAENG